MPTMRVFKSHLFFKIHNLIKRQKSFFKISVAESTNDQSNLRGRMIERPGARRRPQDQVPSKVPSRKGWAKNNKYQRGAGPGGQDLQVPLKTNKIKSGQRQGGRGRRALPRPIGLNPVAGCVPPFFPSVLNSKWKALAEGFGCKTKTINTGYLCPAAETRAPLDRQMGVGLGVVLLQTAQNKNNTRPECSGVSWTSPDDQPDAHKRMLVRALSTQKQYTPEMF